MNDLKISQQTYEDENENKYNSPEEIKSEDLTPKQTPSFNIQNFLSNEHNLHNVCELTKTYGSIILYVCTHILNLWILILWSMEAHKQYYTYQTSIHPHIGLNMIFIAFLYLFIFIICKIVSSIAIYQSINESVCAYCQFFSLAMLIEIYRSHKIGHLTSVFMWISYLESFFGIFFQILLQLLYVIQSDNNNNLYIILFVLCLNGMQLFNTTITFDIYREISGHRFWLLFLFRITELISSVLMYLLIWLVIGEWFLLIIIAINIIHNIILYIGGCLPGNIWNIWVHIICLPTMSYTIVEGKPISFFQRGRLIDDNEIRSKLKLPYSIFMKRKLKMMNSKIKKVNISRYRDFISDMTGIYKYLKWIHTPMVAYLNVYLSSAQPQKIMVILRTVLGLICLLIIGLYGGLNFKSFLSEIIYILVLYFLSIICTCLSMIFFSLMFERTGEPKQINEIIINKSYEIIFDAIIDGNLDTIKNFATKYTTHDLTTKNVDGKTPLYYASELGQTEIVNWLLAQQPMVDINDNDNDNRTSLYIACRNGFVDIVKLLLAQPNCKYNKASVLERTPLYAACREGYYLIVIELLKQPLIDINYLTKKKNTSVLSVVCQKGYVDIANVLLQRSDIDINVITGSGYTPIIISALGVSDKDRNINSKREQMLIYGCIRREWQTLVIEELINIIYNYYKPSLRSDITKLLLNRPEIEIDKGIKNCNETLFYIACQRGLVDIIEILINKTDYEVDINIQTAKGFTPLYNAACFGYPKVIQLLMNIDKSTLNICDHMGRTPFFIACRKGNTSAVFKLLEYDDIDIHKKDRDEMTLFAAACQGGSVKVVEKLLQLLDTSEIVGVDRMERTPFFMACREGQTNVVERLMKEDNIIDINQSDELARTPLMVCVKRGHDECVECLCKNMKIDINQPDHQKRSPLFIAAKHGATRMGVIKILMSRSDLLINYKCFNGKTALHIACELGYSSVVMRLLDHATIDVNQVDDDGVSPLNLSERNGLLENTVHMRMVMLSLK